MYMGNLPDYWANTGFFPITSGSPAPDEIYMKENPPTFAVEVLERGSSNLWPLLFLAFFALVAFSDNRRYKAGKR
jgi:hypothetical protein